MSRILVGVMGERLSISSDMTLQHSSGTILASELKDHVFDDPAGWVELPTIMEVEDMNQPDYVDRSEQVTGTVRIRNVWIGYIAEEDT